jgi:hypothetical protein
MPALSSAPILRLHAAAIPLRMAAPPATMLRCAKKSWNISLGENSTTQISFLISHRRLIDAIVSVKLPCFQIR